MSHSRKHTVHSESEGGGLLTTPRTMHQSSFATNGHRRPSAIIYSTPAPIEQSYYQMPMNSDRRVTFVQPISEEFYEDMYDSQFDYSTEFEDPRVEKLKKKVKALQKELKEKNKDLTVEKEKSNILSTQIQEAHEDKKQLEIKLQDSKQIRQTLIRKSSFINNIKNGLKKLNTRNMARNVGFSYSFTLSNDVKQKESRSCFEKIFGCFWNVIDFVFSLRRGELDQILKRYDEATKLFFDLQYNQINSALGIFFIFFYMIVIQIIDQSANFGQDKTYGILPFSFSFYDLDRRFAFALIFLIFCIALLTRNMVRYLRQEKKLQHLDVKTKYLMTNLVFCPPGFGWNFKGLNDIAAKREYYVNRCEVELAKIFPDEDENGSKCKKYSLKFISYLLLIAIIASTWVISVFLVNKNGLTEELGNMNVIFIPDIILAVIISIASFFVASLAGQTHLLERKTSQLKKNATTLWRFFVCKILFIYAVCLAFYFSVNRTGINNEGGLINFLLFGTEPYYNAELYSCPHDHFIFKLLSLLVGEILFEGLSALTSMFFKCMRSKIKKTKYKRPHFNVQRLIATTCSVQLVSWILTPFFPLVTVISLIGFNVSFSYNKFILRRIYAPPALSVAFGDLQRFMKQAYITTMVLFFLAMAYFFALPQSITLRSDTTDSCGPYAEGEKIQDAFLNEIKKAGVLDSILRYVFYPPILTLVIAYLAYMVIFNGFRMKNLEKIYENSQKSTSYQKKKLIKKMVFMRQQFKKTHDQIKEHLSHEQPLDLDADGLEITSKETNKE